ncbi:MAG: glycosyltransferase family 4 protein [Thermoplasmatota archaeon]
MRITLVSPFDPDPGDVDGGQAHVGGVETVFHHISRGLAQRGHDVTLLCSTAGPSRRDVVGGVDVVRAHRRGVLMRAPAIGLAGLIPSDSQLVHVAATYPFTTPRVLLRARRLGIPSVLDFHFEPAPVGFLAGAAARLYASVAPHAYSLAQAVLVRSLAYGRSARSLSRIPETRWAVVPNGIDPSRFHPGPEAAGDYLLFVGRLVPYKGLDVLLRATAKLTPKRTLVLAGDGPLRGALEHRARALGIDVRFLGHVADDALPGLYRGAQLTLLPSINGQECFGISLLESMACGTPVVASALPGVEELARQGGLVAPVGDADGLARQIEAALVPGALERGPALSRRMHASYSWRAVTQRLVAVYGEAVAPTHPEVTRHAHPVRHPVL